MKEEIEENMKEKNKGPMCSWKNGCKMTKETLTIQADKGLQIDCKVVYSSYYDVIDGKCVEVQDDIYQSMGQIAKSLSELLEKISRI